MLDAEAGSAARALSCCAIVSRFTVLDLKDKLAIARAMMALVPRLPNDDGENFLSWLLRYGQTQRAIDRFWMPVLVSALNEDLDRISVRYAAQVFRESFLKSAEAGRMGVPSVPLSQLYGTRQSTSKPAVGRCIRERLWIRFARTPIACDFVLLAKRCVPTTRFSRRPSTLWKSCCRTGRRQKDCAMDCASLESSPITGIHLWFDREITLLEHAVLLERTIQWMFQKSKILATRRDSAQERQLPGTGGQRVENAGREIAR